MDMKKILHDTLMLALITMVAGVALGAVYKITKNPIARQEELTKQKAYKAVFADASKFEEDENIDIEGSAAVLKQGGISSSTIDGAVKALDASGNVIGYVFNITDGNGYGGDISFSMGVTLDGTTTGVSLLTINETAGLGMKAKTTNWLDQFQGKQVESFESVKDGASADNEIDGISGASVTSKAIVTGVNAGLCFFRSITEGGN